MAISRRLRGYSYMQDWRLVASHSMSAFLGMEIGALCMSGKHFSTELYP